MAVKKPLRQAVRRVAAKAVKKKPVVRRRAPTPVKRTPALPRLPGQPASLSTTRNIGQLRGVAESQIGEEIRGEMLPLETGLAGAERDRARDLADLAAAYGAVQPFVSESAQRYGQYSQSALEAQKGIFREAGGQLDALRQQQAAEAQQLAQQMGGPVPLEDFTGPVAEAQADFSSVQGGGLLHALAGSQAALNQVEQFAGQVFPMVRMEETGKTIRHFEDRIADLNQQIESIKGSAGKRKTTRLNELVGQEREYELGKGQAALERLKADRDWTIARRQQAQDTVRSDLEWANLMGYKETKRKVGKPGKKRWVTTRTPTLAGRQLAEEIRAGKAQEGLSAGQLEVARYSAGASAAEAQAQLQQASKFNTQKQNFALTERASQYIDAIDSGGGPTTFTRYDPIPEGEEGLYEPNDLIPRDVGGKTVYYKATKVTENVPGGVNGSDPREIYKFLTARGIPGSMAQNLIRKKFRLPKWTYSKQEKFIKRKRTAAKRRRTAGQRTGADEYKR